MADVKTVSRPPSAANSKSAKRDSSVKSGPAMLQINSEHKIRSENLPFDIDVWYPALQAFTFRTVFVPLKRTEAQSVLNYQNTRFNSRPRLTTDDVATLQALEARIDALLRREFPTAAAGGGGAFMRLCGRSPKDGEPLNRAGVAERYQTELRKLIPADTKAETDLSKVDVGLKLRAIGRVSWLRVQSGAEAMSLLLSSERVFTDFHDWLQYGEPDQLVFREFEPELTVEYEFRAFVHAARLNALSQYDHYAVYPDLLPLKADIETKIRALWAELHPHVGVETYVADFAYYPSSRTVRLIELSPFRQCTGSAMFRWSNARDADILYGRSDAKFEFRLNAEVSSQVAALVEANWEVRWETKVPAYDSFYSLATKPVPAAATAAAGDERPNLLSVAAAAVLVVLVALTWCALAHGPARRWLFAEFAAFRMSRFKSSAGFWVAASFLAGAIGAFYLMTRTKPRRAAASTATATIGSPVSGQPPQTLCFFYGTLKSGFHWNSKFLSFATRVGAAVTVDRWALATGDSHVPYLLGDVTPNPDSAKCALKHVIGELWSVDPVTLQNLDEYEGVSKGYYARRTIAVRKLRESVAAASTEARPVDARAAGEVVHADVYVLEKSSDELKRAPFMGEYTLEFHRRAYKAIRHILVKQNLYLSEHSNSDSKS